MATATLTASAYWTSQYDAGMAQDESIRGGPAPGDSWQGFSGIFRQDPLRVGDPQVERMARELTPDKALIDVGAGAGRLALPLARRCGHVVAVEPSGSMLEGLRDSATEAGITNVSIIESTWEEAEAPTADIVLCADMVYFVRDIVSFVRKLERHARERVVVMVNVEWTPHYADAIWERVYGEKRVRRPALHEFLDVLWEMGTYPDVEMLPPFNQSSWSTREEARVQLARLLLLQPGSERAARLDPALDEALEEVDGRLWLRDVDLRRPALVSWRGTAAGG